MTLTTMFLAAALFVPSMPPPEFADCEVVTNCVFDVSRGDAKMFAVKIELDATSSNGQPTFTQLVTPPPFLFDPTWSAAKIIRRGQSDPNLRVECSVDNIPIFIRIR